jgi:Transposase IS66 family
MILLEERNIPREVAVAQCPANLHGRAVPDVLQSRGTLQRALVPNNDRRAKRCLKLTRFLEYPELELSNNLAENSMRPVALGRKNWIHIGSAQAGPKVAAILSVVESCRRLKLPVRDYLAAVLPGLADRRIQRLPDLTPTAWVAQHL